MCFYEKIKESLRRRIFGLELSESDQGKSQKINAKGSWGQTLIWMAVDGVGPR